MAFFVCLKKAVFEIRNKNKNTNDDNMDVLVEDEIEQMDRDNEIEREENDISAFNDDYNDGNYEGEEVDNQEDYD